MCVIAVCKNRILTAKEVSDAAMGNPDGIGIAWPGKNCTIYRKGISEKELNTILDGEPPMPLVIHFRFATSGSISSEMCHPYACAPIELREKGSTRHKILFHNGVISGWESMMLAMMPEILTRYKKLPEGDWNDSRMAAIAIALYGEQILQFMDGKYAIMRSNGSVQMYGNFKEKDGIWLSSPLGGYATKAIMSGPYAAYARSGTIYGGDDDYDFPQSPLQRSIYDSLEADSKRGV